MRRRRFLFDKEEVCPGDAPVHRLEQERPVTDSAN
jgi:hypothetical protein